MTWLAVGVAAVLGSVGLGLLLGRANKALVPTPPMPEPDEHSHAEPVWGCNDCQLQASKAHHPSSRVECPDFVPDWL